MRLTTSGGMTNLGSQPPLAEGSPRPTEVRGNVPHLDKAGQ